MVETGKPTLRYIAWPSCVASKDTLSAKYTASCVYYRPSPSALDRHRSFIAIAESFFNLLKGERVRRRTYKTRAEARQDVRLHREFYNPNRKHVRNGMLSPVEFERQQKMKAEGI